MAGKGAVVELKILRGAGIAPWVEALARLRIAVFREFPYLYDGTLEYEKRYLQTYLDSPDSVAVLAVDAGRAVGATTGLPLADETAEFQRPFAEAGFDIARVFYCGESVLLPEYRGRGLYRTFFEARERHARSVGDFDWFAFCRVVRPDDHPRRPADYRPLDPVWRRFGYEEHPELRTTYSWKDLDEPGESDKTMVFWLKSARKGE